jgi:hypothetical protein
VRRYIHIAVIASVLLALGAWVEAVPLWNLGLLDARAATATDSTLSEPALLVMFATAMALSARQLRRRSTTE